MKLTVQLQLLPDATQESYLLKTVHAFNAGANWVAGVAFEHQCANKFTLQKLVYKELRERFAIPADLAIRIIAQVVESFKRDKMIRPEFRPDAAVPYSYGKNYSFKGLDRVSLSVVPTGRCVVSFVIGKYQREQFGFWKGQADLIRRKDGLWFLLVTVDLPETTPIAATDFIGVDLGIVNILTTNDEPPVSGNLIDAKRERAARARTTYQRRNSRSARARLRKLSRKQARYQRDTNHCLSKKLVAKALREGKGIGLEDLTHIRTQTTARHKYRARHSNWSFAQLRAFIEYKAKLVGVPVVPIDPRNTSRTCAVCGYCNKGNRKGQHFQCLQCSHTGHSDTNGAKNIRVAALAVYVKNRDLVAVTAHTRPSYKPLPEGDGA
jgi:putative transposase